MSVSGTGLLPRGCGLDSRLGSYFADVISDIEVKSGSSFWLPITLSSQDARSRCPHTKVARCLPSHN